jgi:hypothetical protein
LDFNEDLDKDVDEQDFKKRSLRGIMDGNEYLLMETN